MGNCLLTKGKENLQIDLLWTNPSPTSAFTSPSITVDYTEYSYLMVYEVSDSGISSYDDYVSQNTLINSNSLYWQTGYMPYTTGSGTRWRAYKCTSNKKSLIVSTKTEVNSAVPYQIYGIKQFKFIQKYVSGLQGIDTNNVITSYSSSGTASWIATQDCYCIGTVSGGAHVYLNGLTMIWDNNSNAGSFPVKQGQTVSKEGSSSFTIYGLI